MKYWSTYKHCKTSQLIQCKVDIKRDSENRIKDKAERLEAISYHLKWRKEKQNQKI